jgi:hypothetical protein
MDITRTFWAWEARKRIKQGWWRDGGIWPRVRLVRNAELDDYIYGDLRPIKPMGLEAYFKGETP